MPLAVVIKFIPVPDAPFISYLTPWRQAGPQIVIREGGQPPFRSISILESCIGTPNLGHALQDIKNHVQKYGVSGLCFGTYQEYFKNIHWIYEIFHEYAHDFIVHTKILFYVRGSYPYIGVTPLSYGQTSLFHVLEHDMQSS